MDNEREIDDMDEMLNAFVALQQIVTSLNYACVVFMTMMYAAVEGGTRRDAIIRNKPFPYYDDWLNLFGKDRANGDLVEGPSEFVTAMKREETHDQGDYSPIFDFTVGLDMDFSMSHNTLQSAAPLTTKTTGKKRPRSSEGIQKGLAEMAETFGTVFKNTNSWMAKMAKGICHARDMSNARKQVNASLQALPLETRQRLRAATMIVNNPKHVDLFFSLSEEEKLEWTCMLLNGLF